MAHGTPDWGGTTPTNGIAGVQDLGEIASRLGAILSFDRRGNVIWNDGFENGLGQYIINTVNANAYHEVQNTYLAHGAWALHMNISNAVGSDAEIYKYLPLLQDTQVGFEALFSVDSNFGSMEHRVTWYKGGSQYTARIRYILSTQKLQYYNNTGIWTDLATGVVIYTDPHVFNDIKLVVNTSTAGIVRVIFNGFQYDIGQGAYITVDPSNSRYFIAFEFFYSTGLITSSVYCDDWTVTINEP